MVEKLRKEAAERKESAPAAIEKRFAGTSGVVSGAVSGMCGQGARFPKALSDAVKGKNPGLGAKISGILGALRK